MDENKLRLMFFRKDISLEEKKKILQNNEYFDILLNLPPTKSGRVFLELLDNDLLQLVISSPYINSHLEQVKIFLNKISVRRFKEVTNIIDFSFILSEENILDKLNSLNLDKNLIDVFMYKIKNNIIPKSYIFKVNSNEKLLIINKFNILLEDYDLKDINLDLVSKLNSRHLLLLTNKFKTKCLCNDKELVQSIIYLYSIFGFDNATKIIDDKFSYLTDSAIRRIGEFNFIDYRRDYRLQNQNEFYHYGITEELLDKYYRGKLYPYDLIKFTLNKNYDEAFILYNKITEELRVSHNCTDTLKKIIIDKINSREKILKANYIKEMYDKLINKSKRNIVPSDVCELFDEVKLNNVELDDKGQVIPNKELIKLLLGNCRFDNDSLFRIVFNKQAFGLNNNLSRVINEFDNIKETIASSNGKLSINSILDIIDILKVKLYHMRPDECDITLETFSKIIKSKEYCNESADDIIKRSCKLHRDRKKKVYSSIPTVKGICNGISYEVSLFDAEYLLSCGIDTASCLKVGGLGEQLLYYCLTNPHGAIIYLTMPDGRKFLCPVVRSGNGLHGNGIDPIIANDEKAAVVGALKKCYEDICSRTKNSFQPIEICTLTGLHMPDYMNNYPEYNLQVSLPLNNNNYNDMNKIQTRKHILYQEPTYERDKYYLSTDKYFQERHPVFKYNIVDEIDRERIEIMINAIAYAEIDFMPISNENKEKLRNSFINLDINDFIYIVGNKDWFIGIKNDGKTLVNYILPYDNRVYEECLKSYEEIKKIFLLDNDSKRRIK